MIEVLQFVFEDFWHFLGCLVFVMVFALWKPVEINVLNGYWKEPKDED